MIRGPTDKITVLERDTIMRLFQAGASLNDVHRETGRSSTTLKRLRSVARREG